jgi:ribosomal protein S18 acetylase RimI-like enzyme
MSLREQPVIRRMTEEDFPSAQKILWETWMATYASFIPERDLRSYFESHYADHDFRAMVKNPNTECFFADVRGEPAGFARTQYSDEERRFYVGSLYVLPGYQGKGVGSALLRKSEERARARSAHEIWLGVMVQNTRALEWYERIGFRFVEETPFVMGGTTVVHRIGYRPIPDR